MAVARVPGAVDAGCARAWLAAIDAHPAWRRAGTAGAEFNPHSSSLRAAALESLDLGAIAAALLAGEVGSFSRSSWHQDGALGFDFLGAAASDGDLLSMTTCWIALTPCGDDAPGLELVDREATTLLPLAVLADAAVRARHPQCDFLRPVMNPGDALVFGGGVLHHTHVAATMSRERTSLELRFFPAGSLPPRLRGDRFLPLH